MEHWTTRYVGRVYEPGVYDCGDLVADVLRDEFGTEVSLPQEPRHLSYRELSSMIEVITPTICTAVAEPQDGDIVLMRSQSRLKHVGVYVTVGGEPYVLHNLRRAGVCLHAIRDLGTGVLASLLIDGFYRPQVRDTPKYVS